MDQGVTVRANEDFVPKCCPPTVSAKLNMVSLEAEGPLAMWIGATPAVSEGDLSSQALRVGSITLSLGSCCTWMGLGCRKLLSGRNLNALRLTLERFDGLCGNLYEPLGACQFPSAAAWTEVIENRVGGVLPLPPLRKHLRRRTREWRLQ